MGALAFMWDLPEKEILVQPEKLKALEKKLGACGGTWLIKVTLDLGRWWAGVPGGRCAEPLNVRGENLVLSVPHGWTHGPRTSLDLGLSPAGWLADGCASLSPWIAL